MGLTSDPRYLNWATPYLLSLGTCATQEGGGEIHHPGPVETFLSKLLLSKHQCTAVKQGPLKGKPCPGSGGHEQTGYSDFHS